MRTTVTIDDELYKQALEVLRSLIHPWTRQTSSAKPSRPSCACALPSAGRIGRHDARFTRSAAPPRRANPMSGVLVDTSVWIDHFRTGWRLGEFPLTPRGRGFESRRLAGVDEKKPSTGRFFRMLWWRRRLPNNPSKPAWILVFHEFTLFCYPNSYPRAFGVSHRSSGLVTPSPSAHTRAVLVWRGGARIGPRGIQWIDGERSHRIVKACFTIIWLAGYNFALNKGLRWT